MIVGKVFIKNQLIIMLFNKQNNHYFMSIAILWINLETTGKAETGIIK